VGWPRREHADGARRAGRAVTVATGWRAAKQGFVWGLIFGATIAASASSYGGLFPTGAARERLARSFQDNAAWAALFGPLRRLDTVAGYTAYKAGMTVIVLGAVWGLLVATRVMRGEEDAGRWELFLSGLTTRGGAAAQAAAGLGAGFLALWVPTTMLTVAAGSAPKVHIGVGAAVFSATSLLAAALLFMAIGMVLSQLAASRHDANLIGAGLLAGAYLVRMAADSDPGLGWLRWLSPIGWIEELRPLTGSNPWPFLPIVLLVTVLVVVMIRVAANRDLGAGAFTLGDRPKPRLGLLGDQAGLTLRLNLPGMAGWVVALVVTGLVFGLVAQAAGTALRGAAGIEHAIRRLGGTGSGATAYLGFVFVVAAGLIEVAAAGQVAAARNEEATGRLENLLVRPVARWWWFVVRVAVALALVVVAGVLAGIAAWVGAASQHAQVGLGELVTAGLNVAPPAVLVLGIGCLAFGLWPRGAIGVAYGVVAWSFLIETLAGAFDSNHWLLDTSPLSHIAPVPAAPPNWAAAMWLVALGLTAAVGGAVAFARRDVEGA
jgi:ABC-2 type transport system permease protein